MDIAQYSLLVERLPICKLAEADRISIESPLIFLILRRKPSGVPVGYCALRGFRQYYKQSAPNGAAK